MKRFALFALMFALAGFSIIPAAQARVVVGIGLGGGYCCGGYGYSPYYGYPGYYGYPAYYAPPVVYSPPPTVVYTQPSTTYVTSAPAAPVAPPPPADVAATQASDVYSDDKGRSCRHFQTSLSGTPVTGTACLQPDGSWRTVGE